MKKNDYQSPEELAMQEALDRIREEYPDFWKDMDGLSEDTTKPDSEKRQRRKFRRRLIAACFIGVCLLSTALAIFVNSDTAHAVKFAMEKKYYQAKGWVQATDPEEVDKNVIIVSTVEEEELSYYKEFWDELKIPRYMTLDYLFNELYIEKYVNGCITATYLFSNEGSNLTILLRNDVSEANAQMWIKSEDVCGGRYQYKIWKDDSVNKIGIEVMMEDIMVSVCGTLDVEELKQIVNGLE